MGVLAQPGVGGLMMGRSRNAVAERPGRPRRARPYKAIGTGQGWHFGMDGMPRRQEDGPEAALVGTDGACARPYEPSSRGGAARSGEEGQGPHGAKRRGGPGAARREAASRARGRTARSRERAGTEPRTLRGAGGPGAAKGWVEGYGAQAIARGCQDWAGTEPRTLRGAGGLGAAKGWVVRYGAQDNSGGARTGRGRSPAPYEGLGVLRGAGGPTRGWGSYEGLGVLAQPRAGGMVLGRSPNAGRERLGGGGVTRG